MNKYLKESVLWAFIALPYVYLTTIWNKLPDRVPTHFSLAGNVQTNGQTKPPCFSFPEHWELAFT